MAEYNLPEEYYQANGYTKLRSGSVPHPGSYKDKHDALIKALKAGEKSGVSKRTIDEI